MVLVLSKDVVSSQTTEGTGTGANEMAGATSSPLRLASAWMARVAREAVWRLGDMVGEMQEREEKGDRRKGELSDSEGGGRGRGR